MAEKEYKATDLIEELGVCRSTAYRLLQRGAIRAYKRWGTSKKGDIWIIPQSALDEYRKRRQIEESDEPYYCPNCGARIR